MSFSDFASHLSNPFVMCGFFGFIFFSLVSIVIKGKLIPAMNKNESGRAINKILNFGFIICLIIPLCTLLYFYYEKNNNNTIEKSIKRNNDATDLFENVSILDKRFKLNYITFNTLWNEEQKVDVDITYPQISGHSNKFIERKINELFKNWAGVNDDHADDNFDHTANFKVMYKNYNILSLLLEDGGVYVGAATGTSIAKSLVINLENGERYQIKDLFRAGYKPYLLQLANLYGYCNKESMQLANPTHIDDNQDFYIQDGNVILIYQRRELCAGADGTTYIKLTSDDLKPIVNPNGPLGYLI